MKVLASKLSSAILISIVSISMFVQTVAAGTVDPDADGHKFAYGENVSWINFEPAYGGGVTVTDSQVTGYAYNDAVGWIDMRPPNHGGVTHDGSGNLSGWAWGENVGWISFSCDNTDSCATVDFGVTVDLDTGVFSGKAWGNNIGWVDFGHSYATTYGVKTSYPNPVLTVVVPESATEGDGALAGQGTVSIDTAPETDVTVNLSSDDVSEVVVPANVTILSGNNSVDFDITVLDDSLLDGTQTATVTASATGCVAGSDTMEIHDDETAVMTVTLPVSATEGDGVLAGQGVVDVDTTVDDDIVVNLASDDATEATVPASVTIASGQNSAAFDIAVVDDSAIDGTQTATVTASYGSWTSGSDTIDVLDDETRNLSVDVPESAAEGDGVLSGAGTVSISGTFASDLTVNLASDDTSEATTPATATIPTGQTSVNFDLTIIDDALADGTQSATITASASGWTSGTDTIDVLNDDARNVLFEKQEVGGKMYSGFQSVYSADLDGDGDMDILEAAYQTDNVAWWENINGSGGSWTAHTIDDNFDGAWSVHAADIDGDGDLDVLGAAYYAHDIAWWENTDGTGLSWSKHTVDDYFYYAASVYAADVDGDGDTDILGAAYNADDIAWWENTDGAGTSWSEHTVDGDFDGASSVYATDMDGDGDTDILGAAYGADDIAWWENVDGNGYGWRKHDVGSDFDGARSVYAADVDGDGDTDILGAAYNADDIAWWENTDGTGASWSEHTVAGDFDGAYSVFATDVDGDGDTDILGAANNASNIAWWENTQGDGAVWSEHTIDYVSWARSVYAEDLDGDGDKDVLAASYGGHPVSLWENSNGDGTNWTEHTVDENYYALSVYASDIDGDGDTDILSAAENAGAITWWEDTDGTGASWTEHTVDGNFSRAMSVHAADVDGDGDTDILGAAYSADDIAWWENVDGAGASWTEHTVDGAFDGAWSVHAADVDGDGDTDILGAAYNADDIAWWENVDGTGASWTKHTVDGDFDDAWSVHAADVDGDGDTDILGAAYNADDIAWWENVDGTGTSWTEHTVDGDFDGASSVHAADVDGDGDTDILGAAYYAYDIAWWENVDGTGASWTEHTVDGSFYRASSVYSSDLDGDGDTDIIGTSDNYSDIAWWKNIDGTGASWEEHTLDGNFHGAWSAYARDIDEDGDVDILGAAYYDGIALWKNMEGALVVSVPGSAAEGDGVLAAQGTVSVDEAPGVDLAVDLFSNDSSEATVPASVTILAGNLSAEFDLTIIDDALLDGSKTVTVTASSANHIAGSDNIAVNDDETAVLTVDIPASASEGDGVLSAQGTVTTDTVVDTDVVVYLVSDDETEVVVTEFLTIPSGQTSATFDLEIMDDKVFDGIQTATVTASVGGWTSGSEAVQIDDNETYDLLVSIPSTAAEEDGILTSQGFVCIPGVLESNLPVDLSSNDTTEVEVPSAATISAGQTCAVFDLTVIDDPDMDGDQAVEIKATAAGWTQASDTISITDNDPGTLQFSASDYSGEEGADYATITVTRTRSSSGAISVDYATSDGTATSGDDYTAVSGTLAFGDGETTKSFEIPLIDDSELENDETVDLTLSNPGGGAVLGNPTSATLTILANDFPGPPYSQDFSSGLPASGAWRYYSSLENGRIQVVSGKMRMDSSTYDPYCLNEAVLSLNMSNSQNVELTFLQAEFNDSNHSIPETFSGHTNGDGVSVSNDGATWYRILDASDLDTGSSGQTFNVDLDAKVASIQSNYDPSFGYTSRFKIKFQQYDYNPYSNDGREWDDISVTGDSLSVPLTLEIPETATEGDGALSDQGTVSLPSAAESELTVNLSSDDTTEVTVPATVTIASGSSTATFDLTIVDDSIFDDTQTVTVTASATGCTSATDTIQVADNENKILTVTVPETATEGDGTLADGGSASIPAVLGENLTVDLSSDDTSEATVPTTVTITAGQTSAPFDLTIVDDAGIDGPKTATITASASGWTSGSDEIEVLDDEPLPYVNFQQGSSQGDESETSVEIAVTLSAESELTATVDYEVTGGTAIGGGVDYTLSAGQLTFQPGETGQVITAAVIDEDVDEDDEFFTVALSSPSNAQLGGSAEHQYTIVDNDYTPVTLSVCHSGCDFSGIQAAIDAAFDEDTVSVGPGTYLENIDFKGKAITVQSTHGANKTVIDGGCAGSVVRFVSGETSASILHGFSIENGCAEFGAGIYLENSSPLIRHCDISKNNATVGGGGVFATDSSSPQIYRCDINDNYSDDYGAGLACASASDPSVEQSTIDFNIAGTDGGGVHSNDSSPEFSRTEIVGNSAMGDGGGAKIDGNSSPSFDRCVVRGNSAFDNGGGIAVSGGASPSFANTMLAGNSSQYEGGCFYLLGEASSVDVLNCTISENSGTFGGGFYIDGASAAIRNSILWNDGREIDANGGAATVAYSDVETDSGTYPGDGNINADPKFVSVGSDYHLREGSPCIGTADTVAAPALDFDGEARPFGDDADMGADEWNEELPAVYFTGSPTSGYAPLSVSFTDRSYSESGIDSWLWDFGDGGSSDAQHPSHDYAEQGDYAVSLTVTDADGDAVTNTRYNYIEVKGAQPTADFDASPKSGYAPLAVSFLDQTYSPDDIVSWNWDFGDGAASDEPNPDHDYTDEGTYTVRLTVTDADGDCDTETKVDLVSVIDTSPKAAFYGTPRIGNAPLTVEFFDSSSSYYPIDTWTWDFGDSSAGSDEQNPSHEYTQEGYYAVTLAVASESGQDTATRADYVRVISTAKTYEVCPGGSCDFTTIQEAIDVSGDGDTIRVHAETYYENIRFNGRAVTVTSVAGAAETIIDGQCADSVASFVDGEDAGSVLDGFTIRNGCAAYGGGVHCNTSSSPTIRNCIVENNTATSGGGGIAALYSSNPAIRSTVVRGNSAEFGGGIGCYYSSSPDIDDSEIKNNQAEESGGGLYTYYSSSPALDGTTVMENVAQKRGGGVYATLGTIRLTDCDLRGNDADDGAGVAFADASSPILERCEISGNAATGDGGGAHVLDTSLPEFRNCLIAGNSAANDGGALHFEDCSAPLIVNCTVADNEAGGKGDGIRAISVEQSLVVRNSILFDGGDELNLTTCDPETVEYSDVQTDAEPYPGTGNMALDPVFTLPPADYRPGAGSPCRNTGTAVGAPGDDLERNARPRGAGYDMGCYEVENLAPDIAQAGPLTVPMDEDGDPDAWSAPSLSATDGDGDVLAWSLASAASHGTATVDGEGNSPSVFDYSPDDDFNGEDSFEIQVSDGQGGLDTITVNVTVESVNDPPAIGGEPDTSVDAFCAYEFVPAASDPDIGDTLTFSIQNKPSWADFNVQTGALTGTPTNKDTGTCQGVTIAASDSAGASCSLPAFDIEVNTVVVAPEVETVGAEPLRSTNALLTGTVNPNGDAAAYYFEYWSDPSDIGQTATSEMASAVDAAHVEATAYGLYPEAQYTFRIVAQNSIGTANGEAKTFTTPAISTEETVIFVEPEGVCGDNTPCFSRIAKGTGHAADGAVVRIGAETYFEKLEIGRGVTVELGWNCDFDGSSAAGAVVLK